VPTILVVQEDDALLWCLREGLSVANHRILCASSGAEGLRVFDEHGNSIHLLITDVVMPQISGVQLARVLKQTNPLLSVLFVSHYPKDILATYPLVPENVFVQMPFLMADVLATVNEACRPSAVDDRD
jgi:two-component system cell cycle sensor histidine kinase/response regulator CckA